MYTKTHLVLLLLLFGPTINYAQKSNILKNSCELAKHIGDTVLVKGKFSRCMEYSGYSAINNDSCASQYNIELDYSSVNTNKRLNDALSQIANHRCGGSVVLILQGLLIRDRPHGYGHAGSNQVKMIVTDILKIGRVKYKKITRSWEPGGLLGVGKEFNFFKQVNGQVIVLYNFLHELAESPYIKPWVIRFGFNIEGLKSNNQSSATDF